MKAIIPANNGMTFDSKQCIANLLLGNKNKKNISMESKMPFSWLIFGQIDDVLRNFMTSAKEDGGRF
jgi:hypothetical protein